MHVKIAAPLTGGSFLPPSLKVVLNLSFADMKSERFVLAFVAMAIGVVTCAIFGSPLYQ